MGRRIRKSRAHLKHWNELVSTVKLMNFAYTNISIYPATHSEVRDVVTRFHAQMRPIFEEQEDLGIGFMDGVLYIEGAMSIEETRSNEMLIDRIKLCRLKYTTFSKNASVEELLQFFGLINEAAKNKNHAAIPELLDEAGIEHVSVVEAAADEEAQKSHGGKRKTLFDWYEKVIESLTGFHKQLLDNAKADVRPLYRLADDMMATIRTKGHDPFLLLPVMGRNLDPHMSHNVNVGIYAGILGYQYGLNAGQIQTLVVAAFLHDLGRCIIPVEWAEDKQNLSLFERAVVSQHPAWSFLLLTRNSDIPAPIALLAAHHHEHPRNPSKGTGYVPDVLHKVLNIVDAYDLASPSDKIYWNKHRSDRYLKSILKKRGDWYDPSIAKALIQMVGYYPVGSLVRLADGQRGVVVRSDPSHVGRPTVYLFEAPAPPVKEKTEAEKGIEIEDIGPLPALADLMELKDKGLGFKNEVAGSLAESAELDARAIIDAKKEHLLSHQLGA